MPTINSGIFQSEALGPLASFFDPPRMETLTLNGGFMVYLLRDSHVGHQANKTGGWCGRFMVSHLFAQSVDSCLFPSFLEVMLTSLGSVRDRVGMWNSRAEFGGPRRML